ncbi:hypothetical protein SK128_019716 [Halocaridina rubra]|uniref:Uncharacterized protein n=1 Tax=Halocaridina rubra TaxID=373956 RepID=A0AAN8WXB4_HALRR
MAVNRYLPYYSISDDELIRLTNNDKVLPNYLCINELDKMIFNPLDLENEIDLFLNNMRNATNTFSIYIYLNELYSNLNKSNAFSVLCMNIRSLANNLQIFVDQCLTENNICDVMGFSETRLDNDIEALYNITAYNMFTQNRDRKGGGVCMYVCS